MATIVPIGKEVYAIRYNGHTLRQHYFTIDAARAVKRQLEAGAR